MTLICVDVNTSTKMIVQMIHSSDATFKDGNSDVIALGESSKDAEDDDQPVKAKLTAASRRPQKTVAKGSKKVKEL
jgi:hypothetical protein